MTSLITLISWGWTITYDNLRTNIFSFPLLIIGLFIHIILGIITFVNNDKYSKYHDYEGFQGMLLILIRLGMFGFSIYG